MSALDGDLAAKFAAGLNVNAAVFVPSWVQPPAAPAPSHLQGGAQMNGAANGQTDQHNGGADVPPDDWDKMDDDSTETTPAPVETTAVADKETPAAEMESCGDSAPKSSESSSNSTPIAMEVTPVAEESTPVVKKKQSKPVEDEEKVPTKEHLNLVFVGHVDAGKSTLGGQIMYQTGEVDQRTLEKYQRDAKEQNRESWALSWALDTNKEEREKGKTVDVGRASFATEAKTFTILDAPGHKSYVPNMIGGAAQADVAILVISARKGEFETGFEKGGQTREHTMLIKTAGVKFVIVVINKMDDPTVEWKVERYEEIVGKLTPFLKKSGFNPKKDVHFMPISGLNGVFIKTTPDPNPFPHYTGPALLTYLDELPKVLRMTGPLRLPIAGKYKDMGVVVCGKIESGYVNKIKSDLVLMPAQRDVNVLQIFADKEETETAYTGENVEIKLKGIEEEDISNGFVLCDKDDVCHVSKKFEAQIHIVDYDSIICPGFTCIMHCHTAIEEVVFKGFVTTIDKKTGKRSATRPRFVRQDDIVVAVMQASRPVCLEMFSQFPQMGRFTLRSNDKTIAMGRVERLASKNNKETGALSSDSPSQNGPSTSNANN